MTVTARQDGVVSQYVDGELLILDTATARYLTLNATGARLWADLAAGTTVDGLQGLLQSEFGAPPEEAERDVQEFLDSLRALSLLVE